MQFVHRKQMMLAKGRVEGCGVSDLLHLAPRPNLHLHIPSCLYFHYEFSSLSLTHNLQPNKKIQVQNTAFS